MSSFSDAQISEIVTLVLDIVPAGEVMMDNFEEMLRGRIEEKLRAKYAPAPFMGTCVLPTSNQLKLVDFDLPFMPRCVRYLGCQAIKYAGGLMLPCGGKCVINSDFCTACTKKATEKHGGNHEYGTLEDREEAFSNGVKYSHGGKTEISFGDFLAAKKKTREEVKAAIRAAGLSLNIPEECFARSAAEKRAGRPKKAAAAAEATENDIEEAPKPKVKKAPMSLEEKIAKLKADEEAKAARDAAKEIAKAAREAAKAEKAAAKAAAPPKEPKEKKAKKASAEKVTEMLNALEQAESTGRLTPPADDEDADEDISSLAGSLDEEQDEPQETFEKVRVKGSEFYYGSLNKRVYTNEDTDRTCVIGTWLPDKNTIDFTNSQFSREVIQDLIAYEIGRKKEGKLTADKRGKFISKFIVNGVTHAFDHESKNFLAEKTGAILWVLNEDGELNEE